MSKPHVPVPQSVSRFGMVAAIAAGVALAIADGPAGRTRKTVEPTPLVLATEQPLTVSDEAPWPASQLHGPIPATVLSVVDGDTVEARVQIWLGQDIVTRVRLRGMDAPELRGACARERDMAIAARDRLAGLLKNRPVWLGDIGRDKYFGRVVARLIDEDVTDLGARLVQEGLARPYDGGRRTPWCR